MINSFQMLRRSCAAGVVALGTLLAPARERPNVLIFLVDDVGGAQ